ncbi:MAG TPA: metal-dependent hydrolase [Mucilaginibacter sp.]|jgi:inner membrane protein
MDSLTHLCLGACTGEILLSKKLSKKALLWGALAQSLPDIDTFVAFFVSPDNDLVIHRSITHSLFFAVIVGLLLALLARALHRKNFIQFTILAFFFIFQLALHDLLDTCNSYGTGLLEPFSHHRFSINLLYVADPLFTISLFIASVFLIFKSSSNKNRTKWTWGAICISILYLFFAGFSKAYVNKRMEAAFKAQHINPVSYFTTPTPLNSMLWYVVAADSDYYTTYTSVWDNTNQPIEFEKHQKNYSLLNNSVNKDVLRNLIKFAGGYYTITKSDSVLYFNILRFEQIQGWRIQNAPFAFSYPLVSGHDEYMLLQKGRLAGWNKNSVKQYIDRIAGRQTIKHTQ